MARIKYTIAGVVAAAATSLAAQACAAVQCIPIDVGQSSIVAQVALDHSRQIEGVVVDMSARPMPDARVRIRGTDTTWHPVGADGRFSFPAPLHGTTTLDVIAAQHDSVSQILPAPTSSGVRIVAVLAPIPAMVTGKPECAVR